MANELDDSFLARWSKRKHALRRGETPAEPAPPVPEAVPLPAPAETGTAQPSSAELPPIESLQGLESDYRDFLRPGVDPATRSAALKKLFGDPHFNTMDRLDTYIDDYTQSESIPPAMLRAMTQSRALGLFDEEEKAEAAAAAAAAEPAASEPAASGPVLPGAVASADTAVPATIEAPETPVEGEVPDPPAKSGAA